MGMLDFVFCCWLFTMGIIAACVDWTNFTNKMFRFDNYAKSVTPRIDEHSGLPTGEYDVQYVENTFHPKIIVFILLILVIFFFVIIYLPAKILFEHLEDKYTPIIARFGLKRITYRKEMKRRGSWPLAYSN